MRVSAAAVAGRGGARAGEIAVNLRVPIRTAAAVVETGAFDSYLEDDVGVAERSSVT